MKCVPTLSWNSTLFKDIGCAKTYIASVNGHPFGQGKPDSDFKCANKACARPHHNNVSRILESHDFGVMSRKAVYYCCISCRNVDMGLGRRTK